VAFALTFALPFSFGTFSLGLRRCTLTIVLGMAFVAPLFLGCATRATVAAPSSSPLTRNPSSGL